MSHLTRPSFRASPEGRAHARAPRNPFPRARHSRVHPAPSPVRLAAPPHSSEPHLSQYSPPATPFTLPTAPALPPAFQFILSNPPHLAHPAPPRAARPRLVTSRRSATPAPSTPNTHASPLAPLTSRRNACTHAAPPSRRPSLRAQSLPPSARKRPALPCPSALLPTPPTPPPTNPPCRAPLPLSRLPRRHAPRAPTHRAVRPHPIAPVPAPAHPHIPLTHLP
jgi:hypothetical protein